MIHITKELSGRWNIPILLSLDESGGRFTPLKNMLQISPSRLSSNLKTMKETGLIQQLSPFERNHPLLPEYKLTEKGHFLKEAALIISNAEHQLQQGFLAAKAWNWPILIALYHQYHEFNAIRQLLQTVTPRILSKRLSELHEKGIVEKTLITDPTPKYTYALGVDSESIIQSTNSKLTALL
ncbi:winged helix-turn-helix transcriptional regulator [Gracilibacillus alcaliphilus]|uniref:winged helix-turn-helix transcriptional regulator n=1 Tax=Gracilibacillus alcaliphilus TaxID=1401441 RepID=UPI00195BD96A|nr:winged helix-turn-helix transcriptional regulator [Gracilibacillus alcaliphilus]MBM7675467.1 DNA-binding HxlR family transcriptional regulator [Gracilibacillus alcaliphilus]